MRYIYSGAVLVLLCVIMCSIFFQSNEREDTYQSIRDELQAIMLEEVHKTWEIEDAKNRLAELIHKDDKDLSKKYALLGWLEYSEVEKRPDAVAKIEKALLLNPENLMVKVMLSFDYVMKKEQQKADELTTSLVERHPDNPACISARLNFIHEFCYEERKLERLQLKANFILNAHQMDMLLYRFNYLTFASVINLNFQALVHAEFEGIKEKSKVIESYDKLSKSIDFSKYDLEVVDLNKIQ